MKPENIQRYYFGVSLFFMFFIGWSVGILSYQGIIHMSMPYLLDNFWQKMSNQNIENGGGWSCIKLQIGDPARSGLVFIKASVEAQVVFSIIGVASHIANIIILKRKMNRVILPSIYILIP